MSSEHSHSTTSVLKSHSHPPIATVIESIRINSAAAAADQSSPIESPSDSTLSPAVTVDTPKPLSLQAITTNMNAAGGRSEQQGDFRAAALYMVISILLIFFNKATLSYYNFGAPNVLTLSQNICSLFFLLVCKQSRLIEFHDFSWRNFRKLLLLGLTFIAYMVFGMIAMKVVNIPMYTTLRRTTVVFVMLLEWIISRKTSTISIKFSVVLMVIGALIAGIRDLNFDLLSYVIVVIYNVCTALYLVLINHISTGEKTKVNSPPGTPNPIQKLDKYDLMFYNNLISIPLLLCIIGITGEVSQVKSSPYWSDAGFLISLIASSVLAFVLNYTIFWNTAVNSALTQTVSGQAKDVVVVMLGFALFDDAHFDPINIIGVCIGFGGSIFYALTKIIPACTIEPFLMRLGLLDGRRSTRSGSLLPFTHPGPPAAEDRETTDLLYQERPHHMHTPNEKNINHDATPSPSPSPHSAIATELRPYTRGGMDAAR